MRVQTGLSRGNPAARPQRTARWLIGLTVALIVLTAVIAALTVALLVHSP